MAPCRTDSRVAALADGPRRGKSRFSLRPIRARANHKPKRFESMLKSMLRRGFAALGMSLALVAGPAQARTPQGAHPALWAVADADTTVYLFGTIHLLPEKYQWRTPAFDRAVD